MTKDRDFSSVKEGDEITVVYTVNADGKVKDGISGTWTFNLTTFNQYPSAFVSKRAPREPKVGDKFYYNDSTNVKTILFIDDKTVFYRFDYHNNQHHSYASRASWNEDAHLL